MTAARTLLAAGLVLAVVSPAAAADLSRYVPDDAEWVVGIEVPRLLDAPAAKHLPALLRAHGADGLTALLGLGGVKVESHLARRVADLLADPAVNRRLLEGLRGHVARILLCGTGNPIDQHPLLIVEGSFEDGLLGGPLRWLGTEAGLSLDVRPRWFSPPLERHGLFRVRLPGEDEEDVFAVRADRGTLLFALRREDVDRALKRANGDRPTVRRELAEAATRVRRDQCVWLVGVPRQAEAEAWRVGGVRLDDGVEGVLTIGARDAEALRDVVADRNEEVRIVLLLAEKQARADKRLAPLLGPLRAVRPTTNGLTVELRLTVSADVLERMWGDGK